MFPTNLLRNRTKSQMAACSVELTKEFLLQPHGVSGMLLRFRVW